MKGIGLDAAQLGAVFPFHFAIDRDLRIVQVGPAWLRVGGPIEVGASMPDRVRLVRPQLAVQPDTLRTLAGSLVVLECVPSGLPLRGQLLPVEPADSLVFVGTPMVRALADLKRSGLSLDDWPPHDAVADLLFLLQSKDVALTEARALSDRLSRQREELRIAVRQRGEAQAAASARETSLRAILDTAADGIVTIDERGIIQSFNPAASRMFGWAPEEVVGRSVNALMPAHVAEEHDRHVARYLDTGERHVIGIGREVEGLRRNGTRFPLYLAVSEFLGPDGRMFTGILHDLTPLKRAQQAVEATQARTRLIVDTALDAVITIDQDARVTLWNAQAEATFGWSREEALGRNLAGLIIPVRLREAHATGMRRYLSTGEGRVIGRRIEIVGLHRDGHEFPVELAITPIREGDALSFSAFVRDITPRKQGERLLQTQHEVTRILAFASDVATVAGRFLEVTCQYLGWSVAALWTLDPEAGGLRCADVWHEPGLDITDFVDHTRATVFRPGVGLPGRVLASGERLWLPVVAEDPNFPRAGPARTAGLGSGIALPIPIDGQVGGVVEFFSRSVSQPGPAAVDTLSSLAGQLGQFLERKRAEQALRQGEARLASVIDNMLEGMVIVDDQLRIVRANRAFARMFGYPLDALHDTNITELMPPESEYQDPASLSRLYRQSLGRVTEHEGRRRNGELFPLELQLYEVETPEGRVIAAHARDLTQERESDRLKKRFVASVSHELRTPLTAIRGSLGLLALGKLGELSEDAQEVVQIAERNAVRLVGIINDLLDFERMQAGLLALSQKVFPLARALDRSLEVVQALADESGITLAPSPTGLDVWADEERIIQVLVNLVGNAIKFSPRGTQIDLWGERRGQFALVQVRDRGRGVPENLREIIFQPFRQAEESDARKKGGSGVGLAICRAIVSQHGGEMGVESAPGEGSVFWFTVPLRPNDDVASGLS